MTSCRTFALFVCFLAPISSSFLATAQQLPHRAPDDATHELDPAIITRLREVIQQECTQKRIPAFSLGLVDHQHQATFSLSFGHADADATRAADAETVYRVGSVSKLFTDIAVMQLVERAELSLDEDLRARIPELQPQDSDNYPITLRQLMSHRSGLVRESPIGNYFDATEPSLRDTVLSLNATSYVYPPGSRTKYSNAGIAVVGYVLERLRHEPFAESMHRQIFAPLQMDSSSFRPDEAMRQRQAVGWMWTYDHRRFAAADFALGTAPAGNLYSSVNDLMRFLQVVLDQGRGANGGLLKPATWRLMMTPQVDERGEPQPYGIGFHISELEGHRKIGHGGAIYGFSTQLAALPDDGLGVVGVASLDVSNGLVSRITDYALRLMLASRAGQPLPLYELTTTLPASRAAQLAGRYSSSRETIELEPYAGELLLRRGSQEYRVRDLQGQPIVDDVLGFGPQLARDAAGRLQIDGQQFTPLPTDVPAAPPERWRGLIGEYGWDHNTLYILEDHGQLVALIEWFFYYPLTELGENEFAFPDSGLYHGEKLIFMRDSGGRATSVRAASVTFPRRAVGPEDGETFRIVPRQSVAQLRETALASMPPDEAGPRRPSRLVEPTQLDPSIQLDIRYATTNNFMGAVFYSQPRAFLQQAAAEALARVHRRLEDRGYGLLIHDAYRPWYVTKMFWDATPDALRDFVADPAVGSRHNRGCAVDLTLYDRRSGEAVPMVAGYDEFSPRSFPRYPGGTSRQRWHRRLLRQAMEAEGFSIYEFEWWHFDFRDWQQFPIMNATFEQLAK